MNERFQLRISTTKPVGTVKTTLRINHSCVPAKYSGNSVSRFLKFSIYIGVILLPYFRDVIHISRQILKSTVRLSSSEILSLIMGGDALLLAYMQSYNNIF